MKGFMEGWPGAGVVQFLILSLATTAMSLFVSTEEALAWFKVCNKTTERVSVAFGYLDRSDNRDPVVRERGWVAEGWYNLNPGECADTYPHELWRRNSYYYYYAESESGRRWGGENTFCVDPKNQFSWRQVEGHCKGVWRGFREVYIGEGKVQNYILSITPTQEPKQPGGQTQGAKTPGGETTTAASGTYCVSVDSRRGWQRFSLPMSFTRIVSIGGGWTVDARSFTPVGPSGHSGRDAEALAPFNSVKYDQRFPFGALLARGSQDVLWIEKPVSFKKPFSVIEMRINDGDNFLVDNGGQLNVCFGN